ncbi:phytanoyl-CoA dioxygenase family protein [Streptomyces bacillaris]|uniref:phytanoyl-CoA dioxygenase family protein n=1 Tax=Streptomyces bacillaris TaxID=68179 RepID=UPI00335CCED8
MASPRELTTPATLPEESVRRYREDGFVHVPRLLSPEEVTLYRTAAENILARDMEVWEGGEDGAAVEVNYTTQVWRKDETLRGLALHPALTGIAARLAGVPLRLYSSEVLVKEPKVAPPTLLHDDEAGLPMDGLEHTLTAWVALVDVPVERGCLSYIPGSHLRADAERLRHMTSFEQFREPDEIWPDFPWRPRVTVPLRAGDVAFHHCRTLHWAGGNETDTRRVGHGVIYMDAGTTYLPGVMDQYLTHLEPGRPLDDPRFFPLVTG